MTIDPDRIAHALATPDHDAAEIASITRRYLDESREEQYDDVVALESVRTALSKLGVEERRGRALAFAACWDGSQGELQTRFARMGFAQGIDYHHVADGEEPGLIGPSFAPISWYDVDGLMRILSFANGRGEQLAACIGFAAFGLDDPRVFEWSREAARSAPADVNLEVPFTSPRDVDDRLFRFLLAPLGEEPSLAEFLSRVVSLQTVGAQDPEKLSVAIRWLDARGHGAVVGPIDLRTPQVWDGGHRSGGNAVQAFLARVWNADKVLFEEVADQLLRKMWAPNVVAAVCASLPFEQKVELASKVEYRRLYRQGRIVVVHTGKTGKDGRIAVKLHPDASKANKDATKKVAKFHQDLGLDLP